jgi:hypothetical protein
MSFHPVIILKRENLPLASGSACLLLSSLGLACRTAHATNRERIGKVPVPQRRVQKYSLICGQGPSTRQVSESAAT